MLAEQTPCLTNRDCFLLAQPKHFDYGPPAAELTESEALCLAYKEIASMDSSFSVYDPNITLSGSCASEQVNFPCVLPEQANTETVSYAAPMNSSVFQPAPSTVLNLLLYLRLPVLLCQFFSLLSFMCLSWNM